jgi:hypothetical protein
VPPNVISGNGIGISIDSSASNNIANNFVGTNSTGNAAIGNTSGGIEILSSFNVIGGASAGARNVISGNNGTGLLISGSPSGGNNLIQGNFIGTDASGNFALPNSADGLHLLTPGNFVGGSGPGAGNIIAGNGGAGILVGVGGNNTQIKGNAIGTSFDFSGGLSNAGHGIALDSVGNSVVGGSAAGEENIIAFNGQDGIAITGLSSGINIDVNQIVGNQGLGIDLADDGITGNDPGDGDSGPNDLQNYPVLSAAAESGTDVMVTGSFVTTPTTPVVIDVYGSFSANPSGFGEGEQLIGRISTTSDSGGNVIISSLFPRNDFTEGSFITALATVGGNSSEFSQAIAITAATAGFVVTTAADSGPGSLRQAMTDANNTAGPDTITFNIGGGGVQAITLSSALPNISEAVSIDATTQPGYAGSPLIFLNGSSVTGDGLHINTSDSIIRGLSIGGFSGDGIFISIQGGADNTVIEACFIGVDPSGNSSANGGSGIRIREANNTRVGGPSPSQRNVISANAGFGINVQNFTNGTLIQGNLIGTNTGGNSALGNLQGGINIQDGDGAFIGGSSPSERNLISGNVGAGISLVNTTGNTVMGNFIGTDLSGSALVINQANGIQLINASSNVIGTSGSGGNLIAGNEGSGIFLSGASNGNMIGGNAIGTDFTGSLDFGHSNAGILIDSASGNFIGDASPGLGNLIGFNNGIGVAVVGVAAQGNSIRGNFIFANGGLGIDLNADGITANDAADSDAGANAVQNFPVINSAQTAGGGNVRVQGTFNGTPNTTFFIDFYSSLSGQQDPSGSGEGGQLLFSDTVFSDAAGDATFDFTFPAATGGGAAITASATNLATGDTSEFAANAGITGGPLIIPIVVTNEQDSGPGSLRQAILDANAQAGPDAQPQPAGSRGPSRRAR